ncbi:uncharacterized protein LOC133285585 [Gastrolobium bilobum]|uniref:uncharacterized protein LOC133285585 n=1 Tax=Gastrolobium bilobum TaxID=150636 RepID=UPI002AB01FF6|nr:uncharacterized protein LOC133285585 [Gastrolobium bilobum]
MEETLVPKRPREEALVEKDLDFEEYSKRHKPYNHILSLLDSEEEESTEDLSTLMTSLQKEITCVSNNSDTLLMCPAQENYQHNLTSLEESSTSTCLSAPHVLKEDEENDKEKVMKHLLQASDDELGIPNTDGAGLLDFGEDHGFNSGEDVFSSLCDKLWELEDETANYYALLQSELFLWGH